MTPQVTFCPEDLPGLWIRPHKYTLSVIIPIYGLMYANEVIDLTKLINHSRAPDGIQIWKKRSQL